MALFTKAENITLPEIQADVINFYQPENSKPEKLLIEEESASPQDLIDTGFERIEREIKDELLSKLKTIDPYAFEKIILILLLKTLVL